MTRSHPAWPAVLGSRTLAAAVLLASTSAAAVPAQTGTCGPCPYPGFCPPTQIDGFFGFEDHRCEDLTSSIGPFFVAFNDSDFSYADLTGVNLGTAHLARSEFIGALLVDAVLGGCFLCDADFSGADLTNANLNNTAPTTICENIFQSYPPPRYDCDTVFDGTYFDVFDIDPQEDGWKLTNPPCATVTSYGETAPAGSLVAVSDRPQLGETFTVAFDDPLGSSSPGSFAALLVSTQPDPNAFDGVPPEGTLLPGLGMDGGPGELLVDLGGGPFVAVIGADALWVPGAPVPLDLNVPGNPALAGARVYTQGVLVAPGNVKLTAGLALGLGN